MINNGANVVYTGYIFYKYYHFWGNNFANDLYLLRLAQNYRF